MPADTKFIRAFQTYPVMASLRSEDMLPAVIASKVQVVLVSSGSIFNISEVSQTLQKHNKLVFAHTDLISGLGRDQTAIQFLKRKVGVDGIVTPHVSLIIAARNEGLATALRFFAHDTPSVMTGVNILRQSQPHFVEIMPGLAVAPVIKQLRLQRFQQPVVAAGLIKEISDVRLALKAGAIAVDTSSEILWNVEDF